MTKNAIGIEVLTMLGKQYVLKSDIIKWLIDSKETSDELSSKLLTQLAERLATLGASE